MKQISIRSRFSKKCDISLIIRSIISSDDVQQPEDAHVFLVLLSDSTHQFVLSSFCDGVSVPDESVLLSPHSSHALGLHSGRGSPHLLSQSLRRWIALGCSERWEYSCFWIRSVTALSIRRFLWITVAFFIHQNEVIDTNLHIIPSSTRSWNCALHYETRPLHCIAVQLSFLASLS